VDNFLKKEREQIVYNLENDIEEVKDNIT